MYELLLSSKCQDDAKSHRLHLFDFFHCMFLNVWVRACKRTLVAIVSLSTVLNQMLLQTARCVFFDVFSNCLLRRMHYDTLWHLLDFFQLCFLMCLQLACRGGCKVTHLFVFSPLWALNVAKYCLCHCEFVKCTLKFLA